MSLSVMNERPDKRTLIITGCYWFVAFFLMPVFLLYLIYGLQDNIALSWVQVCYYGINAVCTFFIYREHLADSWLNFQIDKKKLLMTVLVCVGIFIVLFAWAFLLLRWLIPVEYALPVTELELLLMPTDFVDVNPVAGILTVVICTPLTVSCLLYGLGFAPACNVHPLLGYGVLIAVLALHRKLNYYSVGTVELERLLFLLQLPGHLLACETYRRTDSILAPILFHMILNLLSCLLILIF